MKGPGWIVLIFALAGVSPVLAQMPTYDLGRPPTTDELGGTELAISTQGTELPPGSGTARQGASIYAAKCLMCHGQNGKEGPYNRLVGGDVEQYPFATILWDYIHRAMPRKLPDIGLRGPGLMPDEVYALSAYILFLNNIIKEDDVLDRQTLPQVKMPLRSDALDRVLGPR